MGDLKVEEEAKLYERGATAGLGVPERPSRLKELTPHEYNCPLVDMAMVVWNPHATLYILPKLGTKVGTIIAALPPLIPHCNKLFSPQQ